MMTYNTSPSMCDIPDAKSPFWLRDTMGTARRLMVKAHQALMRANRCAANNNRRRMRSHLRMHNRYMERIFHGRNETVVFTRKDINRMSCPGRILHEQGVEQKGSLNVKIRLRTAFAEDKA